MVKMMTPKDVAEKVIHGEIFILDVRNNEDYHNWKIEGQKVESINIPYFDLIDGVEPVLEQLPKDKRDILVVCAKEGSSIFVAEQLADAGVEEVYYLQGGMKRWSEYLHPVKIGDLQNGGSVYQFNRLGKGCLSYLIESDGEAAIIDMVRITETLEQFAKEQGISIKYLIDTHLHADHISGGRKLAEKVGAIYYLPPKDATEVTFDYEPLVEGNQITVGNTQIRIQALYSPGHTIGSTSLVIDDQYLLSGDILFVDSIGRPDLAGLAEDWVGDLHQTLYQLYKELSPELMVLPAHFGNMSELDDKGGVLAKLGDLYETNLGFQVEDKATFCRMVTKNLPPQPNAYHEIRQINMGKISPSEEEQREMEIGPNRCAVHN